jgi:hypothetical protein
VTIRSISGPQENHIRLIRDGVDTMEKVLRYVVTRFSDQRCLGTRQILAEEDEKQPNGRIFKKVSLLKQLNEGIFKKVVMKFKTIQD